MPRVPQITGPSVELQAAPNAYQRAPDALGAAGLTQARQLAMASRTASNVNEVLQYEQAQADQVRVDDAVNRAKERVLDLTFGKESGYTNLKGINALERESGRPLADEYGEQLQRSVDEITGTLGNSRQKQVFGMRANDILSGFRSSVMQHEGREAHTYGLSVSEGTISSSRREIGMFYNDPAKIDDALLSITGAAAKIGRATGKSAEWSEAYARRETSNALTVALAAAIERNDLAYASGFLHKYSDRMEADDVLRARGLLDKQMDSAVAIKTADVVMTAARPAMAPTGYEQMIAITMQSESGGKRYGADGALLTSPKGAKGEMQVMDGTNKDPGFGVVPAKDDSPEERARVGRDYLGAMVKHYNGDPAKAWAAYNAGPARVDQEVKDAMKRGQPQAWLSNMPKETQAYVAKNVAALESGGGRPERPTLEQLHNQVRETMGADNPTRLKLALDETTRRFNDTEKALKQRDEEAVANAQRWLVDNAGRYNAMPASVRGRVPPGEIDGLLNFADRVAKGEDRTNPAVYQRLSDPTVLRGMTEDQFYSVATSELSQADHKHFANERQRLLTGGPGDKPGDLNSGTVKTLLDSRLRELKMDPTPKDGSDEAARIGALRQFVDRSVLAAQQSSGKKFSDAELVKHIDSVFAQTDVVSGWFSDSAKPLVSMDAGDIPAAVRDRLKADFKAAGVEPTDVQLLGAYWRAKDAQRRVRPLSTVKNTGGASGGY